MNASTAVRWIVAMIDDNNDRAPLLSCIWFNSTYRIIRTPFFGGGLSIRSLILWNGASPEGLAPLQFANRSRNILDYWMKLFE